MGHFVAPADAKHEVNTSHVEIVQLLVLLDKGCAEFNPVQLFLLDRFKDAIKIFRQKALAHECVNLLNDSMKPDLTDRNKSAGCQCYSSYLELKRDIITMKRIQPLDKRNKERKFGS